MDNKTNDNDANLYIGEFEHISLSKSNVKKYFVNQINLQDIKVLTSKGSLEFWNKYFSVKNISTMQTDKDDWVCKVKWQNIGCWIEDFNNECIDDVATLLQEKIRWEDGTLIYFCVGCFDILKTTWSTFLKNWINFLEYNDDGPIIVAVKDRKAISFTPLGHIQITRRK